MNETAPAQLPRLMYSVDEAAALLGITRRQIFRQIESGRLRSAKPGKRRLIPADALTEWVALVCGSPPDCDTA